MVSCPKCKAINLETAVRCKWCGLPLARPKSQTHEEALPSALPPPVHRTQPSPASPPVAQAPQIPPRAAPQPAPVRSEPLPLRPPAPIAPVENRAIPPGELMFKPAGTPVPQAERSAPPASPPRVQPAQPPVQTRPQAPPAPLARPMALPAQPKPRIDAPPVAPRQLPPDRATQLRRVTKPDVQTERMVPRAPPAQAPARMAPAQTAPRVISSPILQPRDRPPIERPLPPPPRDTTQRAFDVKMKMVMRCPGCGKKLEDGNFCKHCGTKLG